MKIQDLNISAASKSVLKSIGLTMVSELAGQNYITLINKFPKNCNIEPMINELNTLGYLLPPSDEISIYDVPMSKRLQNALLRNGVMYLSQLSSYPKEDILHFRNLGEKTVVELEQICQKYGIEMRSLLSIKEHFENWQDKFIFEILPEKNAAMLWKKHKICMLSQMPSCNEYELKQSLSSSNSFAAAIKDLLSIG